MDKLRSNSTQNTNAHCERCYLDVACFYGLLHLILNHPKRDGREVVDGLVRDGPHNVPPELEHALLLTRQVGAAKHDANELSKTCVEPGHEAVRERLGFVGGGWRMVSGVGCVG